MPHEGHTVEAGELTIGHHVGRWATENLVSGMHHQSPISEYQTMLWMMGSENDRVAASLPQPHQDTEQQVLIGKIEGSCGFIEHENFGLVQYLRRLARTNLRM